MVMEKTLTKTRPAATGTNGETEAAEFMGQPLTPLDRQNIAAKNGVQYIDKATYRLTVDGLVEHPLGLSYADLLAFRQKSRLMVLDCVEGWQFTAKWTGPALRDILNAAGVRPEARYAIFHSADRPQVYSALDLKYIYDNNIILALKDNDITLSPERGFPFRVAAIGKPGNEWAKWVTRIELATDTAFRGFITCNCDWDWWWWLPWH